MKQLSLTLILLLIANVPVQAGGNCVSKFECVDTCNWQDQENPDIHTPTINYRVFYQPDGNWDKWNNASGDNTNCKDTFTQYAGSLCPGGAEQFYFADCYQCLTKYTKNPDYTQYNGKTTCCPSTCPNNDKPPVNAPRHN